MVRVRHKVRIRVPFRPITMRSAVLFRKLSYSCKIRNETQSFRSAVPEIIPTPVAISASLGPNEHLRARQGSVCVRHPRGWLYDRHDVCCVCLAFR